MILILGKSEINDKIILIYREVRLLCRVQNVNFLFLVVEVVSLLFLFLIAGIAEFLKKLTFVCLGYQQYDFSNISQKSNL